MDYLKISTIINKKKITNDIRINRGNEKIIRHYYDNNLVFPKQIIKDLVDTSVETMNH